MVGEENIQINGTEPVHDCEKGRDKEEGEQTKCDFIVMFIILLWILVFLEVVLHFYEVVTSIYSLFADEPSNAEIKKGFLI